MALWGLGVSRDAALILIRTMVLLNAVGIAHLRTQAYLNRIRRAQESEIECRVIIAAPIGPEEPPTVESEIPSWMNKAISTLPLSGREREIVVELLKGKTRSEIGTILYISPETVKWHTRRVYRKLRVSTKIELVQRVLAESQIQQEHHI